MEIIHYLAKRYRRLDGLMMSMEPWNWFARALALAFIGYWIHLAHGLNDWLGLEGFHLSGPSALVFRPLPSPLPVVVWLITLVGGCLLFFRQTRLGGCLLAGSGLFYSTFCDFVSSGALNMHFLFAFAVIFWTACLPQRVHGLVSAWPALLVRLYLVVVYFGSGWRKVIYGNWLTDPQALLHSMTGYYTTDAMRWLYHCLPEFSWTVVQYLAVIFELGAPVLLLYPPLRKLGVIWGCLLHLGIALLMKDLFYFSFQMLTFYMPVLISTTYFGSDLRSRGHQSAI